MDFAEIDNLIVLHSTSSWQKVAMIVAKVAVDESFPSLSRTDDLEVIAGCVTRLVESGRLEAQGNLSNWRASEVRLPMVSGALAV